MKNYVTNQVVALACIIGATIVAATGNDGWGWLILAAVLII